MSNSINKIQESIFNEGNVVFLDDLVRMDFLHARIFIYSLIEEQLKIILKNNSINLRNFPKNRGLRDGFDEKIFLNKTNRIWESNYFEIPLDAWVYLKNFLPSNAIVLGYEMPVWLKKKLVEGEFNYIDIRLSPIRFARDLFFLMESNFFNSNLVKKYSVMEEEIRVEAGSIRAKVRHNKKGNNKINE
jgi:hypothetical protein